MPFSFNSFYRVIESKKEIHSRVYRRTFWEKISDAFLVIAGNRAWAPFGGRDAVSENDKGNVARPGILDYLMFQLVRMFNQVTLWSWNNLGKDPIAAMLIIPTAILCFAANIVHYAMAAALTLVASPIVAIVHFFSQVLGGSSLKNEAGKLRGYVYQEYATVNVKDNTLGGFLHGTGHSYSDIIIDLKKTEEQEESYEPILLVMENHHKYECCIAGDCDHQKGHIQFAVNLGQLSAEDKVAIKALIKLNAGSLRDNLKTHGCLNEIESSIDAPSPGI